MKDDEVVKAILLSFLVLVVVLITGLVVREVYPC